MEKQVLDEKILLSKDNTIFPMTWLGSQLTKKVRLSMRAWQLGSATLCEECQEVIHARNFQGILGIPIQGKC